ncbi:hypothetical protein LCGC14_1232510 [marine sediment metagenome]|uniref:Phage recombination protein Bet n=1 Tax=marine sediment metagenome TaxID=412755 RepID=A0A0F9L846_9ZZZZ
MLAVSITKNDLRSIFDTYTDDQITLIKQTVCKNATTNELKLFLYKCQNAGLDPLSNQIYAIKRGTSITVQTSIDGLRAIADRTGRYSPGSDTKYAHGVSKELLSATAYVKKMTPDGKWHEISATAFFSEYAQEFNGKLTRFWNKMPSVMLSKCAEANALRRAFPVELSGLYSSEEMANGLNKDNLGAEFLTEEIVGTSPQDDVKIDTPIEEDPRLVDLYIDYLSQHYGQAIPTIKKWINDKPVKFWEAYHKWIINQKPSTEEVSSESDTKTQDLPSVDETVADSA